MCVVCDRQRRSRSKYQALTKLGLKYLRQYFEKCQCIIERYFYYEGVFAYYFGHSL